MADIPAGEGGEAGGLALESVGEPIGCTRRLRGDGGAEDSGVPYRFSCRIRKY